MNNLLQPTSCCLWQRLVYQAFYLEDTEKQNTCAKASSFGYNVSACFRMFQLRADLSIDEILTDSDVRELLGVSRTTLWRLRHHGNLPYGRVGREYRYRKSEILGWLKDHENTTVQLPLQLKKSRGGQQ